MRNKIFILLIIIVGFAACKSGNGEKIKINPLNELKQVDILLSDIAEKPQTLVAHSNKKSKVTGAHGTVIHVDPERIETVDGSPLGEQIQIELLELTNISDLILQNVQTVSNGKILITGGAYYLNMTSNGKQLKIKKEEGIEVEFPNLTENEMTLFLGERDSLGQVNWIQAEQKFRSKELEALKNQRVQKTTKKTYSEIDLILNYIDSTYKPKPLTEEEIRENEREKREYETKSKTYQAIELMNFGWINCDRFLDDPNPRTNINLLVQNDSISSARLYVVFKEFNSVMTEHYWRGQKDSSVFKDIPVGQELQVIALSAKDETPYIFEASIKTSINQRINVDFTPTTHKEIKEKLTRMN